MEIALSVLFFSELISFMEDSSGVITEEFSTKRYSEVSWSTDLFSSKFSASLREKASLLYYVHEKE